MATTSGRWVSLLVCGLVSFSCLLASGETCPASGDGDYVLDPWSVNASYGNGGLVQADGKIVVAGYAAFGANCASNSCLAVARYDSSGCRDASFGSGGLFTNPLGGMLVQINSLARQSDGRYLAAGLDRHVSGSSVIDDLAVARITDAGAMDTSFGGDGWSSFDLSGRTQFATSVGVQRLGANAGKIVAAGSSALLTAQSSSADSLLVRFTANGSLDSGKNGFGSGKRPGYVLTAVKSGTLDRIEAIAVQSDDRIVAAGFYRDSSGNDGTFLSRYTADGALDSTFGSGGIVFPSFGGASHAYAVALQSDGKIVVAGEFIGGSSLLVARFLSNGALDRTAFNAPVGYVTIDADPASIEKAEGLAIDPSGRIVVAAHSIDLAIAARLSSDGTLDGSFGFGGLKTKLSNTAGERLWPQSIAIRPDGDLSLMGTRNTGTGASSQPFLMKFLSN